MIRPRTVILKESEVSRQWHLIDADGQTLGRLATQVSVLLRGKQKPAFTPGVDCGDSVVIVNAEKIHVTGTKMTTKTYKRFSGYPSGLKIEPLGKLLQRRPTEVIRRAVRGMLHRNPLGYRTIKRLHIYAGPKHPHTAQLTTAKPPPS